MNSKNELVFGGHENSIDVSKNPLSIALYTFIALITIILGIAAVFAIKRERIFQSAAL